MLYVNRVIVDFPLTPLILIRRGNCFIRLLCKYLSNIPSIKKIIVKPIIKYKKITSSCYLLILAIKSKENVNILQSLSNLTTTKSDLNKKYSIKKRPREESNPYYENRNLMCYPLHYEGTL